jgi:23S rRNA (guanosine2251-2'-O)-methyltransferase
MRRFHFQYPGKLKYSQTGTLDVMEVLYGLHPVTEAIRSKSREFDHICFARERQDTRLQLLIESCREAGIRLRFEPREHLARLAKTPSHQGVVAIVRERSWGDQEDLVGEGKSLNPLLLALDGIEDPQNLGALLRVADGSGVDGVIVTERRSAPLSPVAIKASAGAAEHVQIAKVVNMVRSLEWLKQQNVWCIGLDERGTIDYDHYNYLGPCCLVLGREGEGLHELVRKTCDQLLRIPMAGKVSSLNVSAAGAVVLYEAFRQRREKIRTPETLALAAAADQAAATKPKKLKGLGS